MTRISEILYEVDSHQLMVPRFQRGWVWKKKNVLQLFESLYHGYPVGSLITWPTQLDGRPIENVIDGQQRLTALYGVIRGKKPPWFADETAGALENLMFNVETETFEYATQAMHSDPLWTDITVLYRDGLGSWARAYRISSGEDAQGVYYEHIAQLIGIRNKDLHIEKLPADVRVEAAAKVFEIVNRAGTRVSEGDLVLGQLSLKWESARQQLMETLDDWRRGGYGISLEWLLHAMSASLDHRIDFKSVLDSNRDELIDAFELVQEKTSEVLNQLRDILGIDQTTSTAINNGLIVVVLEAVMRDRGLLSGANESRRLVGWWFLSTLHNRWTGDIRNRTNKDLAIVASGKGVSGLLQELRSMSASPLMLGQEGFTRNRSSKSYYRLLQTLTRRRGARDLRSGLGLSFDHFGANASLEAHHIFPRSYLNKANVGKDKIDQLANLALITKGANLKIGSKSPAEYLPGLEEANPGVLKSQWIPEDPRLWTLNAYPRFLEERCMLLAEAANELMHDLIGEYR